MKDGHFWFVLLCSSYLVVVSDHGMTENGNHGGSSYEETDSLALFIGLRKYDHVSVAYNTVNQVDLAPTLALLFGVPIPSNNAGNLIAETFHSLTDEQQLRALELNSWQLLRLLQVQLPDLLCGSFSCHDIGDDHGDRKYDGNVEEICFCLYQDAAALHNSWKLKSVSRSNSKDDYIKTVSAYCEFLTTASEWLSRRATDKPFGLLASGFMAMLLSCLVLLSLLLLLGKEVYPRKESIHKWHLAETFTLAVILILVLSMGSSSMVEEEQYIWHFMSSTFFLVLLRKVLQSFTAGNAQSPLSVVGDYSRRIYCQLSSIIVILVCGRVLRGWHQGGVNWTNLPDISKWLETAGSGYIKSTQLVSTLLVMCVGLFALSSLWSKSKFVMVIGFIFVCPGFLILQHMRKHQDLGFTASDNSATLLAQLIYAILALSTMGTVIASPWIMSFQKLKTRLRHDLTDLPPGTQSKDQLVVIKDSIYLIGWGYIFSWCLLQLLLQQPINSMPILLLLVQILASISCASNSDPHVKQWVEIAALYYLGMAGHFGFGNTNTLATIDVAGAFIGISCHSTLLSGVLMFMITYAAPTLSLLSIMMYISVKDLSSVVGPWNADLGQLLKLSLGFPCLVPLGLNSVLLIAYTIVLLLMRNHLFVWSVFSPKYLYVCATTACVYLGVFIVASTVSYTLMSTALWSALQGSNRTVVERGFCAGESY